MKKIVYVALVLISVACGGGKTGSIKVDNFSTGKAGEVLLIMDEKYYSEVSDTLLKSLNQPQPAINQIEPMFHVIQMGNQDFSSHFKRHRNIINFNINTSNTTNTLSIRNDQWATPQIYVLIKGNNLDSCMQLYFNNEDRIINTLYENDLKRVQRFFIQNKNPQIQKVLTNKFRISLAVPNHYFIAREEPDFLWLRYRTVKNDRFIMVYKNTGTSLNPDSLIHQRNKITAQFIPGAVQGAYPIVAEKSGFPIINPITINGKQGYEMRGLWESVRDKMGGPFYSFTYTNKAGELITIDGFVYAPQEEKRDFLREVEAIVKSVK